MGEATETAGENDKFQLKVQQFVDEHAKQVSDLEANIKNAIAGYKSCVKFFVAEYTLAESNEFYGIFAAFTSRFVRSLPRDKEVKKAKSKGLPSKRKHALGKKISSKGTDLGAILQKAQDMKNSRAKKKKGGTGKKFEV